MLAAQYLLTKKMDKEATPVLHQVLEIDPENTPARLQLLSFAIREQNMDEVIKLCAPADKCPNSDYTFRKPHPSHLFPSSEALPKRNSRIYGAAPE
jgi:hypothetical protein